MFGAESLKVTRKGGDLLLSALQKLPSSLKQEITLLTIGTRSILKKWEVRSQSSTFGDRTLILNKLHYH
ncbi:hypothetical protein [Geminocystis herdmanii]|uniref:hypothetical protein n=1 Tax=Geminocystis herdmanii TaxID=669359 RepID=UPI000369D21B|nr:hypothetical protein [Geminocystis herdmanii]